MRCDIYEVDGETIRRADLDAPPVVGDTIVIDGRNWSVANRTLDWDEAGNDHVLRIGVTAS